MLHGSKDPLCSINGALLWVDRLPTDEAHRLRRPPQSPLAGCILPPPRSSWQLGRRCLARSEPRPDRCVQALAGPSRPCSAARSAPRAHALTAEGRLLPPPPPPGCRRPRCRCSASRWCPRLLPCAVGHRQAAMAEGSAFAMLAAPMMAAAENGRDPTTLISFFAEVRPEPLVGCALVFSAWLMVAPEQCRQSAFAAAWSARHAGACDAVSAPRIPSLLVTAPARCPTCIASSGDAASLLLAQAALCPALMGAVHLCATSTRAGDAAVSSPTPSRRCSPPANSQSRLLFQN